MSEMYSWRDVLHMIHVYLYTISHFVGRGRGPYLLDGTLHGVHDDDSKHVVCVTMRVQQQSFDSLF